MIYIMVDEVIRWPHATGIFARGSSHMTAIADADEGEVATLVNLHRFARSIGISRRHFQPKSSPHYDLIPSKRRLAIEKGATFVPARIQAQARLAMRSETADRETALANLFAYIRTSK